jgi:site-specific recombinase XerD
LTREEIALSTDVLPANEQFLKRFIAIKTIKGCAASTLKYYALCMAQFFKMVQKPVRDITTNDIRYYLAIRAKVCGKVTLDNELRVLRSFFDTMLSEGAVQHDPTKRIDKIKCAKKVKSPFTELEMERIRQACTNRAGLNKKHLAIVEVLYSTGCRVSELAGINRDEIDGDRVLVTGKGNKQRYVYLNPRAAVTLEAYLKTRTDSFPALFVGQNITTKEVTPRMDKSSTESIIRGIGKRAGVKNCHPHRFRRTAATTAMRRGMPIEQVSKMLGHEQLTTTQLYAITDEQDVQRAHARYLT